MDVFEFTDYKEFVNQSILQLPRKGHGTYRRLAEHLTINSVMISQIFKGDRHLTPEQALLVAEFFGLNELSSDYLILLVQIARAGTHTYKTRLEKRRRELLDRSRDLKARLPKDKELSGEAKATFYSRWYYSGVRLASSIEDYQTPDQLATRLGLSLAQVNQVVQFLVENGLCVQEKGRVRMGPRQTHLGADSNIVGKHHLNWRVKAMSRLDGPEADELFFTAPMALSHAIVPEVRKELVRLIEKVRAQVVDSESETLSCLNIDWFRI